MWRKNVKGEGVQRLIGVEAGSVHGLNSAKYGHF